MNDKPKKDKAPSAAELEAELAVKRAQLADTIDQLTGQLDPRANLNALKSQLSETAANASEEAGEFWARLQRGEQRAVEVVGFVAAGVLAVVGTALISRGRR